MNRRIFTATDGVLLLVLAAANAALWGLGAEPGAPAAVEIVSREGARREPLGPPRRLAVAGPLGDTLVALDGQGARIESSPCPLQLCVRSGALRRPGQVVACLPNRVAIRLRGRSMEPESGVDAVGR